MFVSGFTQMIHSGDGLWQEITAPEPRDHLARDLMAGLDRHRTMLLDESRMRAMLNQAPHEDQIEARLSPVIITLPMPDGDFRRFAIVESPVLSPELALLHPNDKTYVGQGVDHPAATVRFDFTTNGFHSMIISPEGYSFIDPYGPSHPGVYACYSRKDSIRPRPECTVLDENEAVKGTGGDFTPQAGETRRTYRLAVNATGEYTTFFGGVTQAEAQIITTVNRVNGVYENDFCIRLNLVYKRAYPDPSTDPFGGSLLSQNQTILDSVLGSANYDVGHLFTRGGGGIASLRSVCVNGSKARGLSGLDVPMGDIFDIDYVAHEMGHQFGGNHTFNGTAGSCNGNRVSSTAYEPGSGSTIMAYAGICGSQDVQSNSDPYFHTHSFSEIIAYTSGGVGACGNAGSTGNSAPVVDAGPNYTIPRGTPFKLTATASDANGDTLTYCWEQYDLGTPPGTGPLFRSRIPTIAPFRTFPRLTTILSNGSDPWEVLPTVDRTLNFRCTVRDNRAGGGGSNFDFMRITVSGEPFQITAPNTNVLWNVGTSQTVTWSVGGGSIAPFVNILLSTNGGSNFDTGGFIVLKTNTPNDGSEQIVVPNIVTTTARLKLEAVGNVFFDINNANFRIQDARIAGDVDGNGCVDDADLLMVLFAFGTTGIGRMEDLNRNGVVDDNDLLMILFNFGNGC